jgi:iron complex outermembrane receptor protein
VVLVIVFKGFSMQLFFKAWARGPKMAVAVAVGLSVCSAGASAQNAAISEVFITGNPLGRDQTALPVNALGRADLLERGQSTLGETLNGLPGVSSTYFGPNASRPIIRGQEGDRIRILQNSGASVDASGLSHDHAVPSDPISMERIEVLRGAGSVINGMGALATSISAEASNSIMVGCEGMYQHTCGHCSSWSAL